MRPSQEGRGGAKRLRQEEKKLVYPVALSGPGTIDDTSCNLRDRPFALIGKLRRAACAAVAEACASARVVFRGEVDDDDEMMRAGCSDSGGAGGVNAVKY